MNQPNFNKLNVSLHGDFWTRFLIFLLRLFPNWFCEAAARPITMVFYVIASTQRSATLQNIRVLEPELSTLALWTAGYRVFLEFALTYLDRLWHLHFGCPLKWDLKNHEQLAQQLALPGGVLLFTAHSGNYDIATTVFAKQFTRPLHIVRLAERTEALQEFRAAELQSVQGHHPQLRVHYGAQEWRLGLELWQLLRDGAVVAVQGDRLGSPSPPIALDCGDITFQLPRGPLMLAELARVPCYPIFLVRLGRCSYRLESGAPFYCGEPRWRAEEIGQAWLSVLRRFLAQHWDQWFVFETLLSRSPPSQRRIYGVVAGHAPSVQTCE